MLKKTGIFITVLLLIAVNSYGLNKIRWKQMDWHIYETEHFKIYYYKGEEFLAKLTSIFAEEAFTRDSDILKFQSKAKIPLFIYEDSMDFSATNITLSFLGEGTGGFTEAFKNRIALPASGSFKQLREVVYHEVTHAIQYNILFGEGFRSYNTLYKDLFVPLWVMEGQAEYCADDFDTIGDMILRDAVINDRLISIDKLDGFMHLEEVYLAYKEAQSVFDYIDKNYGSEVISKFIHLFADEIGIIGVFKKVLKKEYEDFQKEWEFYLNKKYWAQVQGRNRAEAYGPKLTDDSHVNIVHNQSPVLSPDGKKIVYISTRDGHREIFMMRHDGKNMKKLFGNRFEGIAMEGMPVSWSKDNRTIYFVSKQRGKRYIFRGDTESGSVERIDIEGMYNVYSPAVSPDDRYIAFTGLQSGLSDIYIYDLGGEKLVNITNNVFENNFPCWSENGDRVVFTEERNEYRRVAVFDVKEGKKRFVTQEARHNYSSPVFSGENTLVYTSDKNGIYNLYELDLKAGEEKQLTNVINGIFQPSVSEDFIAYSYYEDACYNVYKYVKDREREFTEIPLVYGDEMKPPEEEKKYERRTFASITVEAGAAQDDDEFVRNVEKTSGEIIKGEEKYITTLTPDLMLGLLGFASDSGFMGGGYLTLSDMLGNHNIALLVNYIPGYMTQLDFEYLYMSLPFDVGLRGYYHQDVYELYDMSAGEFFQQLDTTELGGSLYLKYPFDLYSSLSLHFNSRMIVDKYTNYETENTYVFNEDETHVINTLGVMYESDYSAWRDLWPYSGDYFMGYFEVAEKMFGGTRSYTILELDYRKHFDLSFISGKNTSLSLRGLFAMTGGNDRPYFIFGGQTTLRGLRYGEYTGDKVLLASAELRHTLAKNINFKLWPFSFIMIKNFKVMIFDDAGLVRAGEIGEIKSEDIKNGIGAGFVIDTFILQRQYTPLKFEFARRTDTSEDDWKFYFSISTGF